MIDNDRFVILLNNGVAVNNTQVRGLGAVRLNEIGSVVHYRSAVIMTARSSPESEFNLDCGSGNPSTVVLGWARLVAFGWPGRRSPIIEAFDLEWIGAQEIWPPRGFEAEP